MTPKEPPAPVVNDEAPPGHVKSVLPCTPLAIVKCLEYTKVYNTILPYGDRAYGKTVTVINRYDARISFVPMSFRIVTQCRIVTQI